MAGLQVACEAYNVHVGGKFLGYPPEILIFSVGSHCQDIVTFYLLSTPISLSCMCNSCALGSLLYIKHARSLKLFYRIIIITLIYMLYRALKKSKKLIN